MNKKYLACEKLENYLILIFIAGFFGGFTYTLRGGVFCNAQTANFVLMGIAFGSKNFAKAFYYFLPVTAYFLGSVISEAIPNPIRKHKIIRWDTILIIIEMLFVLILGLLPETAPFQITQVAINFIAAMQYNTFRQASGVNVATTFVTNHLRQVAVSLVHSFHHKEQVNKLLVHLAMITCFTLGAICATILGIYFQGKSLLFTLIPFAYLLIVFLISDLKYDKELANKPKGH